MLKDRLQIIFNLIWNDREQHNVNKYQLHEFIVQVKTAQMTFWVYRKRKVWEKNLPRMQKWNINTIYQFSNIHSF